MRHGYSELTYPRQNQEVVIDPNETKPQNGRVIRMKRLTSETIVMSQLSVMCMCMCEFGSTQTMCLITCLTAG